VDEGALRQPGVALGQLRGASQAAQRKPDKQRQHQEYHELDEGEGGEQDGERQQAPVERGPPLAFCGKLLRTRGRRNDADRHRRLVRDRGSRRHPGPWSRGRLDGGRRRPLALPLLPQLLLPLTLLALPLLPELLLALALLALPFFAELAALPLRLRRGIAPERRHDHRSQYHNRRQGHG
jgi:hypothetical protein